MNEQEQLALLADAVGELYAVMDDLTAMSYGPTRDRIVRSSLRARLAALRSAPPREDGDGPLVDETPQQLLRRIVEHSEDIDELDARLAKLEAPDGPQVDEPERERERERIVAAWRAAVQPAPSDPAAPRECPECGHANDHGAVSCHRSGCTCPQRVYRLALRLADVELECDGWQRTAQHREGELIAARRDAEDRYSAEEIAAAMADVGYGHADRLEVQMRLATVRSVEKRGNEPPAAKKPTLTEPVMKALGIKQHATPAAKAPEGGNR